MDAISPRRPFLGVESSATGRLWRDRLDERASARALAMVQRHGLPELLARVVAGRGIEVDAVDAFLDPSIKRMLPDPYVVNSMQAAAERIADAIVDGEQVAIFGDYDVDGATASALLARFLRFAGSEPLVHIPDRIFEGYGPNSEAIRSLAARGARLLVTVDCGTTSHEPLAEAARLGLDVVVIDHHQADEQLPPAVAVVNPNRLDDLSGLGHLAAVGLTFLTVIAVNRELRRRGFWNEGRPEPDLLGLLDLVALGTVADVVPLRDLNRAFVAKGLIAMRRRDGVGLTALMDVSRLSGPPEPWHLGFLLGPRINAGGRIGRADLGARLLLEDDPIEAAMIAAELDRLNRERQAVEQATLAQAHAEALAALGLEEKGATIVTAAEGWHPGVVGLVAARLKERFGRPAFAIALGPGETGTGSGRSIAGVDLGRAVRHALAGGLLLKGGGHAMAAGVTLRTSALQAFRAFLEETLAPAVEAARREDALRIDAAITAAAATTELCATLARAGPFGAGNPEPVLALPSHTLAHAEVIGQAHVRARLRSGDGHSLQAIAFRAAGQKLGEALLQHRGQPVHVAGSLSVDRWQGEERVQLRILDVAPADPVARMRG
ncbi:MAG TPA: single-stranded-DNA-specific exonuclease RecJ [Xanthobacteraceae bacterium]|nr:single-stranded-DNA-specific exonuclease RecJ [Xanthobacteraceae bacterium]